MPETLPTIHEAESKVLEKLNPDDRSVLSTLVRKDDNLKKILLGMIESAKGLYLDKKINKDGVEVTVPVYQKEPNTVNSHYIINQLLGRPTESSTIPGIQQNVIIQNEIIINDYAKGKSERKPDIHPVVGDEG